MSQDRTTAASSAAGRLWQRLFGGPLLRLPGGRTRETRRLRSAVGVSLAFHGLLFAGGSLLTASGLLRSGGSVQGVQVVLETTGLSTGPMRDRSYAPPAEVAETAPELEVPPELPALEQEPPPTLEEPPAQLASVDEAEPMRLEPETAAREAPAELEAQASPVELPPVESPVEVQEAPPVLASVDQPAVDPAPPASDPDDPLPVTPEPITAEPPIADTPPALPPTLATAPELPEGPAIPDPAITLPPSLAEAPAPTPTQAPEPPAEAALPEEAPEPTVQAVEPTPAVPPLDTGALAAFEPPPAAEAPVVRSLEAPNLPEVQPVPPSNPEPEVANEPEAPEEAEIVEEPQVAEEPEVAEEPVPDAPTAIALPPDPPPVPELPEPEANPVGPLAWSEPFLPPRADPRIIDELTSSALQSGRADGLDSQISAILSDISCGALSAHLGPSGQVEVRGFITSSNEQETIRERLSALNDVAAVDDGDVLVVGAGLCDGLGVYADGTATLAPDAEVDASLPPELQRVMTPLFGTVQGARETFVGPEYLEIYLTTPEYPAHVYIDYFKPDGTVVHLIPSEFSPDAYYPTPRSTIPISSMEPNMAVPAGPPYGMGMVVTLSASAPVFQPGSLRPREELAEDYLRELELALREREIDPEFRSVYGYVFVEVVREGAPLPGEAPVSAAEDTVVDTPSLY